MQLGTSSVQLGQIHPVDARQVWPKEESDFTPWLARNIDCLSQALNIEIEATEIEKRVGDYELDIYAFDKDNPERIIIIENQLSETDHKHLGQLMAYAAGLDAKIIIWVSPDVRDEHRKTIGWLNQVTTESISFYLVRVKLIRIDNSLPAVQFEVEVAPSEFERAFERIKPKSPSVSPSQIIWGDSPDNPVSVATWKDVFLKALERAVNEEGADLGELPIKSAPDAANFRSSIPFHISGQTTFIDSHGSGGDLRRKTANVLKKLRKPDRFMRIECENGSVFELP